MKETTKLIINRIFSILSGVVAGALVIGLLERVSYSIHPYPENLDPADLEAISDHIHNLPFSAFAFILLAHGLGALVGGFIASKMAKIQKRSAALFVGLILMVAGVLNLVSISHPLWFSIADIAVYVPLALAGNILRKLVFRSKDS